jgi:hypothetical protein
VKIAVTGGAVLAVAGVVAAVGAIYFLRGKAGAVIDAINPASENNLINKGVTAVAITGGHNGYSYDDHFFAALDLINPWNESDIYAETIWGLRK